ncbi:extracellular solute-binding protein [Peribacillus cavernae]|uniref:Extracellular solute-binding protein n=1 Tax=Peribacillus cavernae TaxID=1674310 RepID=A0A433HJP5_9BACI|nr:ABC transporter substrate-binding protein [Peribacillus cavernae]MDQ0219202.1 iron(III) transport system substrate-binding protein [Peribacillus cavernae]RUQ28578.1 extracellular solute-binding protein [Peribacillus cavernae]
MRRWNQGILLAMVLVILAGCGNNAASNQGKEGSSTAKAEGGRESIEGTLHFYTSQPDADAAKLVESFQAKYPEVKVETFRSGTEEVISKLKAERLAGDIQADVLLVADSVTFESLKEDDLLLSYKSPELSDIPQRFADSDGRYTGTKVMATGLAVNTKNVKEMPTGWNVLTSDEAKGKIAMPSPLYSGAAAYNLGVLTRQNDFGWDFYKKIETNDVSVTKGNGDVLKAVAGGEKNYGMIVDYLVARAKAEGSPVELVYPEEGVPVITEPIGIMNETDNQTAAKAFVDYVLSEEGQQLAAELGYTPIRKGVEAPKGLKTIEEMNVIEADISELYQARETDKQKFEEIFGAQ